MQKTRRFKGHLLCKDVHWSCRCTWFRTVFQLVLNLQQKPSMAKELMYLTLSICWAQMRCKTTLLDFVNSSMVLCTFSMLVLQLGYSFLFVILLTFRLSLRHGSSLVLQLHQSLGHSIGVCVVYFFFYTNSIETYIVWWCLFKCRLFYLTNPGFWLHLLFSHLSI